MLSLIFLIAIIVLISIISIVIIYHKKHQLSKRKRLRDFNFETLLDKANKLVVNAIKDRNDKNYSDAIIKWKTAIKVYLRAISESLMLSERVKIMENIQVIRKNLCGRYFKQSEIQVKKAKEYINQNKLNDANKEFGFAKENIQNAITIIKKEKLDIAAEIYYDHLDLINSKIEELTKRMKILNFD